MFQSSEFYLSAILNCVSFGFASAQLQIPLIQNFMSFAYFLTIGVLCALGTFFAYLFYREYTDEKDEENFGQLLSQENQVSHRSGSRDSGEYFGELTSLEEEPESEEQEQPGTSVTSGRRPVLIQQRVPKVPKSKEETKVDDESTQLDIISAESSTVTEEPQVVHEYANTGQS